MTISSARSFELLDDTPCAAHTHAVSSVAQSLLLPLLLARTISPLRRLEWRSRALGMRHLLIRNRATGGVVSAALVQTVTLMTAGMIHFGHLYWHPRRATVRGSYYEPSSAVLPTIWQSLKMTWLMPLFFESNGLEN